MKYAVFCAFLVCARAETLHYAINWQSGLNLGEATLTSEKSNWVVNGAETPRWSFNLDIDAGIPGFSISDQYESRAGNDLCSVNLEKTIHHGSRRDEETVTFDQEQHSVTRETHPSGIGGKSDFSVPSCARDALAFLQFVRQELAQGHLAPQGPVILGAEYDVRLEFAGTEQVKKMGKPVDADKIHATIRGPASDLGVDIFFAKDDARTPLGARIPLSLGTFSVELAH
jgi:hypothetical protein